MALPQGSCYVESCKICNKPCLFFSFEPISPLLCSLLTQAAKGPCKDGWELLFFFFLSVNSCEHNCCQSCLRPRSIREIISLRLPCRQPFSSWQAGCCVCCTLPEGGKRVRERSAGPQVPLALGVGCPGAGVGALLPWCLPAQQRMARGERQPVARLRKEVFIYWSLPTGAIVNRAVVVQ